MRDDARPNISHSVMLGTPNQGSHCADVMESAFQSVGKNVEVSRQLRQNAGSRFNGWFSIKRREVPVKQAINFGLTFMTDAQISATLCNDKEEVAGKYSTKNTGKRGLVSLDFR